MACGIRKYLTDEITNNALEFLSDQSKTEKPFFLYVAFNAPHWPLQALPEDIAKYKGKYAIGWDSLRSERIKRQKLLGISDPKQAIAKRDPEVPLWENLTFEEKKLWESKMEVYAAMVDHIDQSIGRRQNKLKELKKDENTLIIKNFIRPDSSYFNTVLSENNKLVYRKGYCSDIYTDATLKFLKENKSVRFFLYVSFNAPHDPLHVPKKYEDLYKDLKFDSAFDNRGWPEPYRNAAFYHGSYKFSCS